MVTKCGMSAKILLAHYVETPSENPGYAPVAAMNENGHDH